MFRCKAKYQKLFFVLVFFSILIFYVYNKQNLAYRKPASETCDLNKVNNIIENLCDLYSKNIVYGSLCNTFCNKRKSYRLVKCYNNYKPENFKNNDFIEQKYDDFKVVIEYKFNDIDDVKKYFNGDEIVILKSRYKYFYDFDHYVYDIDKMKSVEILNNFLRQYLESTISHNFKFDVALNNNQVFLNYLLKLYDKYSFNLYEKSVENNDIELLKSYILNFLSLLQQDEYLFYKYFQNKQNILNVYGTCGHFYALEKASSLKPIVKTIGLDERKNLILDFLDLVDFFDKKIASEEQSPMQICDVKLDNFGLNKRDELKVIDTDMIHLDKMIFNGDVCTKHEDCNYFDCKGVCDFKSKKCEMKRIDNNLKVICEKIFSSPFFPDEGLITGAQLTNEILKNKLRRILQKCIEPVNYNFSEVKSGAGEDIMNEMENLLRKNKFI
jgi:hypothetical protein